MKKLLILVLLHASILSLQAQQLYIPNGSMGESGNNNVLIGSGVTNPGSKLFINSYEYNALTLRRSNTAGGGVNMDLINGLGYRWSVLVGSDNKFYIGKQGTEAGDVLTIDTQNRIGIGTKNPSSKLHVDSYEYNALTLRRSNTAGGGVNIDMINGTGYRWSVLVGSDDKFYIGKQGTAAGDVLTIDTQNRVGIGTRNPDAPLTVAGNIHAREIKVTATAGGADFVFADDYTLPKLHEVEAFVKKNKHLPEIPSAAEMEANGLHLAEMNIKLLQKVEELTLYVIAQERKMEEQANLRDQEVNELRKELEEIKKMISSK